MANLLTTKEATLISDLLIYEEQAFKKAKLYSKILMEKQTAEHLSKIAENHKKRFDSLFNLL